MVLAELKSTGYEITGLLTENVEAINAVPNIAYKPQLKIILNSLLMTLKK